MDVLVLQWGVVLHSVCALLSWGSLSDSVIDPRKKPCVCAPRPVSAALSFTSLPWNELFSRVLCHNMRYVGNNCILLLFLPLPSTVTYLMPCSRSLTLQEKQSSSKVCINLLFGLILWSTIWVSTFKKIRSDIVLYRAYNHLSYNQSS